MEASIASLLDRSPHAIDACVIFTLLWVADGSAASAQGDAHLQSYLASVDADRDTVAALRQALAGAGDDDFALVCGQLRRGLDAEGKRFLLELAIRVATEGQTLATSANFILRFLADLFALDLAHCYREVAGEPLPPPGDPSSVEWWAVDTERQSGGRQNWRRLGAAGGMAMTPAEARAVLGVRHDAGPAEIKLAYRRLMHLYHPDKHTAHGEQARQLEQAFLRARRAYEVLR